MSVDLIQESDDYVPQEFGGYFVEIGCIRFYAECEINGIITCKSRFRPDIALY
jgi:hypothetical protein